MIEAAGQPGRTLIENWPLYQGTKQLKAIPMSKEAYCALRGWTVPADEDPNEVGYVVEYQDGGKPNVEGFAGYVSWSPADVFEKAYRPCGSHVDRMKIEYAELDERTTKLTSFIDANETFAELDATEQNLLRMQLSTMRSYRATLGMRIERVVEAARAAAAEAEAGNG